MNRQNIWEALSKAEMRARSARWKRLLSSPLRYPALMAFNKLLYPLLKRGITVTTTPFFGVPMRTVLPSGTDIVLNGIKSHDSEIRLSKFFCRQIEPGDIVIDIGAHYGYYTLLASVLTGAKGKVYAVEASAASYPMLHDNIKSYGNITSFHRAASDAAGELVFYEYPGPFAEYNTMNRDAYLNQAWYQDVEETINRVQTLVLDDLIRDNGISKALIKIDAEGGELSVLRGLDHALEERDLTIIMEYLLGGGQDSPHHQALQYLLQKGYIMHVIDDEGQMQSVSDLDAFLMGRGIDSDNVVLVRV